MFDYCLKYLKFNFFSIYIFNAFLFLSDLKKDNFFLTYLLFLKFLIFNIEIIQKLKIFELFFFSTNNEITEC